MTNTNYPSATPTPESKPSRNRNAKNLAIGLLAAGLLGTWAYVLVEKSKAEKTETTQQATITRQADEKSELQANFNASLARLDSITGANNNLQGEKTSLQKDIDAKKAEIRKILNDKNATAAQLAKARTMIADLNAKISGLEEEVARLSGENQELTVANTNLKQEKADLETNLATTVSEKDELASTVDIASTFSASNIQVTPVDEKKSGKEKVNSSSKKVDKLVVSFDVENRVAKSGPADMYLIVTAPDGSIVGNTGVLNTRTDGDRNFTAKIPLDYTQGQRKPVQYSIRQDNFQVGNYKIEVYHNGFKIGEGTRSIKKGGLFG